MAPPPTLLLLPLLLLSAPPAARASSEAQALDLAAFEAIADRAVPVVGLVLAPVLCFFGLAWYAHVALALGFLAGGALFALGAFLLVESDSPAAVVFMLGAFIGGGALGGCVLRLRPAACTFLAGGALGVALAVAACCGVAGASLESPLVPLASAATLVLVGALFVRYERPAVIAWTSVVGAYWWLYGVGYFVGVFPTWRQLVAKSGGQPTAAWGGYLAAFVALAAWSLREQWRREQHEQMRRRQYGDGLDSEDGDEHDDRGGGGRRKHEWRGRVASPSADDVQSTPFRRV